MIHEHDSTMVVGIRKDREGTYLELPPAPDADYRFTLYLGEPQIHAALVSAPTRRFWYWPFAEHDYEDIADQESHFLECVGLLLRHPTRIVQRRTLLGAIFRCEAETNASVEPIGGSLSVWFRVPRIAGRTHTYRSSPVASEAAV